MIKTNVPMNEYLRLRDLYAYQILDTAPEEDFDELAELAAMICSTPISLITFIDKDRQWFKAKIGVEQTQCRRDITFCNHVIQQDDAFIVTDAQKDARFADNPMVAGEIRIRFYAGVPIYSSMGYKIGTICVIDKLPRILLPEQTEALQKLSRQVSRLLELRSKNTLLRKLLEESTSAHHSN